MLLLVCPHYAGEPARFRCEVALTQTANQLSQVHAKDNLRQSLEFETNHASFTLTSSRGVQEEGWHPHNRPGCQIPLLDAFNAPKFFPHPDRTRCGYHQPPTDSRILTQGRAQGVDQR